MFDIGAGEVLVLLVAALFVFGPDRLPTIARQAGRWVNDLRVMVANARRDLTDGLGVDEAELSSLRDLDPRHYVRRNVLDGLDLDGQDDPPKARRTPPPPRNGAAADRPAPGTPAAAAPGADETSAPRAYDPDAT